MMSITIDAYRRITPLLLFVASGAFLNSVQASPILWTGNNHLYEVITSEGISFSAARTAAQAKGVGWDLASITSELEQNFVNTLLLTTGERDHYWLGGSDATTEGDWQWLDGEVWIDGTSYENWWNGEPNDSGAEDNVAMDFRSGSWKWNDINAGNTGFLRGYIVERVAVTTPEPTTLVLMGLSLIGLGFNRPKRISK